ncbi:hypothetical protein BVI434_90017 [Burkholderia vietnamiensis]|nr:hypothetical protein BVI434_90017 [Burkholderia vietnamiensis]
MKEKNIVACVPDGARRARRFRDVRAPRDGLTRRAAGTGLMDGTAPAVEAIGRPAPNSRQSASPARLAPP